MRSRPPTPSCWAKRRSETKESSARSTRRTFWRRLSCWLTSLRRTPGPPADWTTVPRSLRQSATRRPDDLHRRWSTTRSPVPRSACSQTRRIARREMLQSSRLTRRRRKRKRTTGAAKQRRSARRKSALSARNANVRRRRADAKRRSERKRPAAKRMSAASVPMRSAARKSRRWKTGRSSRSRNVPPLLTRLLVAELGRGAEATRRQQQRRRPPRRRKAAGADPHPPQGRRHPGLQLPRRAARILAAGVPHLVPRQGPQLPRPPRLQAPGAARPLQRAPQPATPLLLRTRLRLGALTATAQRPSPWAASARRRLRAGRRPKLRLLPLTRLLPHLRRMPRKMTASPWSPEVRRRVVLRQREVATQGISDLPPLGSAPSPRSSF
mmetsp:Transcript_53721/g.96725  ORF Transcript_53721/g.96725 Transcript_53721/m.96725 type:complete len:382 (-) Transcript_53721:321-1466(-)